MLQIAILLLDLLAGRASAQLVCDAVNALQALETPANVKAVTDLLRELAPKLGAEIAREVHAVATWFATRPAADWGPPDYGGNVPATFGDGPPVETRPEPEGTRDPGEPGT